MRAARAASSTFRLPERLTFLAVGARGPVPPAAGRNRRCARVPQAGCPDDLLDTIRALIDADTCSILLLDEERHELVVYAAAGIEEELEPPFHIPVGKGFAGRVAADLRPVVLPDVEHADVLNPLIRRKGIASLPASLSSSTAGRSASSTSARCSVAISRGTRSTCSSWPPTASRSRSHMRGHSSQSRRRAGGSRTCRRSWTPASPISSSMRF